MRVDTTSLATAKALIVFRIPAQVGELHRTCYGDVDFMIYPLIVLPPFDESKATDHIQLPDQW